MITSYQMFTQGRKPVRATIRIDWLERRLAQPALFRCFVPLAVIQFNRSP